MPRSRKYNSKKVKNNTRKVSNEQNGGLLKVSNEQNGGLLKVSNEQNGGQVQGLSTYMELSIYDKEDPTQNITLEWNDLTIFYKENGLLPESNLFIVSLRETTDVAFDYATTVFKNMTKKDDDASAAAIAAADEPETTIQNKAEIINMFESTDVKPTVKPTDKSDNIIHYEIINKQKTIKFLLIVLKLKKLFLEKLEKITEIIKKFKENNNRDIVNVQEKIIDISEKESPDNNKFYDDKEITSLLDKLFVILVAGLKPKETKLDESKIKPDFEKINAKDINSTLDWNESELFVLEYFSKDSNTIYGILTKFLEIDGITSESLFIEPKKGFFKELFEKIDDYNNNSKIEMILLKGKADAQNVFEELFKKKKIDEQAESEERIIEFEKTTPGKFMEGSSVSESLLDKKKYYMIKHDKNVKKLLGFFIGGSTFLSSHDLKKNSIDNYCLDNKKLKNDCELYYSNDKTYIDNRLKEAVENTNKIEDYTYKREFDKIIEQIQIN